MALSRSVVGSAKRAAVATSVIAGMMLVLAGRGASVPEPSTPGAQLAEEVGALTSRLAQARSRLSRLNDEVELKLEDANKARVDLLRAERASARAQTDVRAAEDEAEAAAAHVTRQQRRLDELVASAYRHGGELRPPLAAFGATNPRDALARLEMLDNIGESELDVLGEFQRATVMQANKDSLARRADRDAEAKRAVAGRSRELAEQAENIAIAARTVQGEKARQLEADKASVSAQLAVVRPDTGDLPDGSAEWEVTQDTPATDGNPGEEAIQRALSQVGVVYAWGGGNASGPTRGIRDGGVADAHGDYDKVGFDCSGLMLYAFAGAGVRLEHYSGYQYESGHKVPLSSMRRADMLFWRNGAHPHHVALYLGGGQMVEAPYSGSQVRVTPVRYDSIAPYAVRLL